MIDRYGFYIKINLGFFDEGEKTEKATPKKKTETREKGQVAKSQEIGTAFMLIAIFFSLRTFAPGMYERLLEIFNHTLGMVSQTDNIYGINYITSYINYFFLQVILIVLPIFAVAIIIGLIVNLAQVGWHPTTKPLKPTFSRLNPLSGFKRLFSFKALVDLFKSLFKFGIIVYVIYTTVKKEIAYIPVLIHLELMQSVAYLGNLVIDIGLNIGILYILVAAADYAYTRYKFTKDIRMTKQEVKEEYKQSEGNPQIKGKIRQKMREASMRRMMHDVPKADVIITNPTHYAIALRYDSAVAPAPMVIAKGTDYLAKRIKDIGKENKVEIVENKQLARAIYATVDIGKEIPPELYQAVAEILAFVYKLKNKAS